MAPKTKLLPFYLPCFLLILVCNGSWASQDNQDVLDLSDLKRLVEIYAGEFDSIAQNQQDTDNGATGDDLHYRIQRFHVPVKVPSLEEAAGVGAVTRQFYLEQYFNNGPSPRQSILNIVLRKGEIEMEMHKAVNDSLSETWKNWRSDRSVFEGIETEDLKYFTGCNKRWTRSGACRFTARTEGKDCVLRFLGQQVYIESEVNVTETAMDRDDRFLSVADDTLVSGANTPYVYDKVSSLQPLPDDDNLFSKCYTAINMTCQLLKETKRWQNILYRMLRLTFPDCFESRDLNAFFTNFC